MSLPSRVKTSAIAASIAPSPTRSVEKFLAKPKAMVLMSKIMKQVLKMRKMKQEELMEQEELLTLYLQALGMAPAAESSQGLEDAA